MSKNSKSIDAERIISLLSFKLKDISKSLRVIELIRNLQFVYYRLSNGDYVSLENNELIKIANIIGERKIESKSALKGWLIVLRKISVATGRVYKRRENLDEEILRKQAENEKFYKEKNEKLKEILELQEKIEHRIIVEMTEDQTKRK